MANFRLVSRLTAVSSLLSILFAFRSRPTAAPELKVDGLGSQRAPTLHADDEERCESSSWPPPEDMYWGM